MSVATLAKPQGELLLPSYLGRTPTGERATGKDTDLLAHKLIAYKDQATPRRAVDEDSPILKPFSRLAATLTSMAQGPPEDVFGRVAPSRKSVDSAIGMMFPLVQYGYQIPEPIDVDTDHDGGIRIVWENNTRFLELVVPYESNAAAYLYHSEGDNFSLDRDLKPQTLRKRFDWLRGL